MKHICEVLPRMGSERLRPKMCDPAESHLDLTSLKAMSSTISQSTLLHMCHDAPLSPLLIVRLGFLTAELPSGPRCELDSHGAMCMFGESTALPIHEFGNPGVFMATSLMLVPCNQWTIRAKKSTHFLFLSFPAIHHAELHNGVICTQGRKSSVERQCSCDTSR